MHEIKTPVTDDEFQEIKRLRKKLRKSGRVIMREALQDYITKQNNFERGLDQVYVRARYNRNNTGEKHD